MRTLRVVSFPSIKVVSAFRVFGRIGRNEGSFPQLESSKQFARYKWVVRRRLAASSGIKQYARLVVGCFKNAFDLQKIRRRMVVVAHSLLRHLFFVPSDLRELSVVLFGICQIVSLLFLPWSGAWLVQFM